MIRLAVTRKEALYRKEDDKGAKTAVFWFFVDALE